MCEDGMIDNCKYNKASTVGGKQLGDGFQQETGKAMTEGSSMDDAADLIGVYFTVDDRADAYLRQNDIPPPVVKIFAFQSCNSTRDELFVKVTKNRKEKQP